MTPEEKQQLQELLDFKKSLEMSSSIPLSIDQAFRERFPTTTVSTSAKSASSENQQVDESGVAIYNVLKAPDAFVQVEIGSTIYFLPAFT